jgi:hypothetical protein
MYKDFFMHICKHCNTEFKTLDQLRRHTGRIHKINAQQLYNEVVLNNNIPKCKCGCGETTSFISFTHGYKEWMRGHISRIENNWGHNQRAIDNSHKTRKEQFDNGERTVWNIGLTKETDIRVKLNSDAVSNSFNTDRKLEYSKRMSMYRLDGTIPTKWGIKSANWKGGTSSINNLVRANKRLYTKWIYPILKRDEFKCTKCGSIKELEVHHNKEVMSEIIAKYVNKSKDYTFDKKREIMNMVIDYHISNDISGETLCKSCHCKLHPSYNI